MIRFSDHRPSAGGRYVRHFRARPVPLASFHPLVARWFETTLGRPTPAQAEGWAAIGAHRHTLIAAPTGSGKTLAAFLSSIDALVREAAEGPLPDEVRVVYVSPLKALSADIHKNLSEPLAAIQRLAAAGGLPDVRIAAAVRTGDTPASQRAAMLRTPPHILVTTPESLYLLLTSARSRQMLATARTVIVDEIHAVIGTRRGAHLSISLERLDALTGGAIQRIGLSATQKPIDDVGRFLVGCDRADCAIVDAGHTRARDLGLEIPASPLSAVMAHEVWEEYYDRLTELILAHTTTLVFVNTRRLAERVARHLSERLGEDQVTAHHGSLSKDTRLSAEHRLKNGQLKALVATASLELGIDIGHVDLVCQIGSPHRIATLLQRVGRSGHSIAGTPKGRLFPLSLDDLIECAALLRAVRRGELDAILSHDAPLDVLAQQITAETSCQDYGSDALFDLVRRAWPYRALARERFDQVVAMLSDGFTTRRGRRSALVHRDEVHDRLRARRGSRLLALTSGGAIPELADYRVILEPEETFIGTVNEDFAIESMAGDIFQLGNASWQVRQVVGGTVRVADAHGAPPTIPFWFGEAPARSDELSAGVSTLRADADRFLAQGAPLVDWLREETGLDDAAALQAADYLQAGRNVLGAIPTQETLVLERFFDESGGMQLVLHAPYGSRINRAWALALRKRFCRQFNFELQAAATEDALMLSLGPQHSFPLSDVFRYLHPATVRDILIQAFLDAPVFATRWRWNTTISLAVPRHRGGRKVPPQLQRMQADDLMAAVFPDAAACLENIPGDREIPDHPLVDQTVRDCLEEAMDLPGLIAVLSRIHAGELRLLSRDTPEPSVFADDILNARPYAFLDDAPLEERRTQAVQTRGARLRGSDEMGALDLSAIERVRDEARPDPRDADELHDALMSAGFLLEDEAEPALRAALASAGRATRCHDVWIAAERLPEWHALHPDAPCEPPIVVPAARLTRAWTREQAIVELLRGRFAITGPITAADLAWSLGVSDDDVESACLVLESEGVILRGSFTPGAAMPTLANRRHDGSPEVANQRPAGSPEVANQRQAGLPEIANRRQAGLPDSEWCERGLLARIHRYTLTRLRAEIAPVSPADFMRHLFAWQHVDPAKKLTGPDGLRAVLAQLDGLELPARAWERDVLPARLTDYHPSSLDVLCLTGDVGWARLSSGPTQVVGATPIALFLREQAEAWSALRTPYTGRDAKRPGETPIELSEQATRVLECLHTRGASFRSEIAASCGLSDDALGTALAELVAQGQVSSDGFAGLRALFGDRPSAQRRGADGAGRWAARAAAYIPAGGMSVGGIAVGGMSVGTAPMHRDAVVETMAWTLLRRYGIVFRRLLAREHDGVAWRELARVYRRLEARGEIRGGRFVSGMSGEQFALPDAVDHLREIRRSGEDERLIAISAADPLNLAGIITPGDRLRAVAGNRIVYRNGVPIAAMEGDMLRTLTVVDAPIAAEAAALAAGRRVPVISGYVGRVG
jgi:ATP-dependent helicase Lhr and Lhr-like helicase